MKRSNQKDDRYRRNVDRIISKLKDNPLLFKYNDVDDAKFGIGIRADDSRYDMEIIDIMTERDAQGEALNQCTCVVFPENQEVAPDIKPSCICEDGIRCICGCVLKQGEYICSKCEEILSGRVHFDEPTILEEKVKKLTFVPESRIGVVYSGAELKKRLYIKSERVERNDEKPE